MKFLESIPLALVTYDLWARFLFDEYLEYHGLLPAALGFPTRHLSSFYLHLVYILIPSCGEIS